MKREILIALTLILLISTGYSKETIAIPECSPGTDRIDRMQTGFDYDGDGSTEIIIWESNGMSHYVGIFSAKKGAYIHVSVVSPEEQKVISGDFDGDGQMDVAIDRNVICF